MARKKSTHVQHTHCVFIYVCTCLCTGIHDGGGDQRSQSGVLLNFSTLFSEVGLLAAQEEAHLFDKASWLTSPGSHLYLPSLSTGMCMPPYSAFYMNTGDLNLGPHSCMRVLSHLSRSCMKTLKNVFSEAGKYNSVGKVFARDV